MKLLMMILMVLCLCSPAFPADAQPKPDLASQARETLKKERLERQERFKRAVKQLMDQERCRLVPVITITGDRIQADIITEPLD